MVGHGLGKQRFPASGWADQEDALWRDDADLLEQLRFDEWQFYGFTDGFHLLVQPSHVLVRDGWFFDHFSAADHWIPRL